MNIRRNMRIKQAKMIQHWCKQKILLVSRGMRRVSVQQRDPFVIGRRVVSVRPLRPPPGPPLPQMSQRERERER
ncbi:unnamed protein product, partial [Nesidiocoris tenuis]